MEKPWKSHAQCREIFTTALRNSVMNVSSECVDNFHWLSSLAVSYYYKVQPAGTVTINSGMHVMFRLFREKCSADRSWKFILVGPGKPWKSHGK